MAMFAAQKYWGTIIGINALGAALFCFLSLWAFPDTPQNTPVPKPLGQLVDLGGYKLHLLCTGKGSPTVVMSAGSGDFSFDWDLVQPKIAEFTQVCSYDRAGEAWSDLGPKPRTRKQEASDLHRLLLSAGIRAPYVLVGHSLGGLVVQAYGADYPTDLVGMVLIDASNGNSMLNINGRLARMREFSQDRPVPGPRSMVTPTDGLSPEEIQGIEDSIKKYDFMRPTIDPPYDKLPADVQKLQLWAISQPKHWVATQNEYFGEEGEALYEWSRKSECPLGDMDLIVLSRGKDLDEEHTKIEEELTQLSRRGQLTIVKGAGHHIQIDEPQAVVDAVRKIVNDARHSSSRSRRPF
jgi:pimeloyl-ACP methyl ester carboxylesterase